MNPCGEFYRAWRNALCRAAKKVKLCSFPGPNLFPVITIIYGKLLVVITVHGAPKSQASEAQFARTNELPLIPPSAVFANWADSRPIGVTSWFLWRERPPRLGPRTSRRRRGRDEASRASGSRGRRGARSRSVGGKQTESVYLIIRLLYLRVYSSFPFHSCLHLNVAA